MAITKIIRNSQSLPYGISPYITPFYANILLFNKKRPLLLRALTKNLILENYFGNTTASIT